VLFPVTAVILAGCLAASIIKGSRRSALTLVLAVWTVEIVLISLPIFRYEVNYSLKADLFVAACLLAATVAYLRARRPGRTPPARYWNRQRETAVAQWLGVIGIVGCLLLLADTQAKGTELSISYLLQNLSSIRAEVFEENTDVFSGPLALMGQVLAPCALLAIVAAVRLGRHNRAILWLGVACFALTAAVSLFAYGGRAQLFQAILLALIGLYLGGRRLRLRPRTLMLAAALAGIAWFFSITWYEAREGSAGNNKEAILLDTQRATLRPPFDSAVRNNPSVGSALISLGYFASPLPTLSFYTQQEPLPGPYWGGYSYPQVFTFGAKAAGGAYDWQTIRVEVFQPFSAAGYYPNVWVTWLRDLLVDFGYLGAVAFCALFAWAMAAFRNRYEATGALHYHMLEAVACFVFAFGAFTSYLWASSIAYAFFAALGATFAVRLSFRTPAHAGVTSTRSGRVATGDS
jgi:hypothetical protein